MHPTEGSWWEADVTPQIGMRYGFTINGVGPVADPRATSLPDGPHGLARIDSKDFKWSDHNWTGRCLAGQVIYELHVGTFTPEGTFAGVISRLDYLRSLGVTAIELMPVQPFGGSRNWGYDGVFWHAVFEGYGGREGLKALVNAAHAHGIAVILDVVYNHFGPDGNYTGLFGSYTAGGSTGWGEVVNLSGPGSDEVRSYILDAVYQWLYEFHIDGLRLDAVHSLNDVMAYSIMEDIQYVAEDVEALTGCTKIIIAESDLDDPRLVTSREGGGFGLAGQWVDDIHHAVHTLVSGEHHTYYADFGSVSELVATLRDVFFFTGRYSTFRDRHHGRPVDTGKIPASRFITYTTTHDQTGNRAQGDRPSMNLSPAQQVLKAAVIYCSPYTPMLFMGEEFGALTPFQFFVDHSSQELNDATRAGRLREFSRAGWDPQEVPDPSALSTFENSKLDWSLSAEQESILEAYTTLLRLRTELKLSQPWLNGLFLDHGDQWVAMGQKDVFLLANFSEQKVTVPYGGELIYSFTSPEVKETSTTLDAWGFALVRS